MRQEFIRTAGLKGFRKSKIRLLVENPEGDERELLRAEVSHIKRDKRRHSRPDYITLFTLPGKHKAYFTYNIATHNVSVSYFAGYHHGYAMFREEELAKLIGSYSYLYPRYRGLLMTFLLNINPRLQKFAEWYEEEVKRKIRKARSAWFRSAKARRKHRT
jgi:hypothetical protein